MTRPQGALARAFWQVVAVLFLLMAGAAQAAMPARPNGPVLDQAAIIPDADEAALAQKLTAYNRQTGRALMVVTVNSLDGDDVNAYTTELGHRWGVGGKGSDLGAILLVAPNERKLSIQAGYGLEEYLPDVLAYRIINSTITPHFKKGDYSGGINAGVDEMITQLNRDPADAKAIAEAAAAAKDEQGSSGGSTIASALFWVVLIVILIAVFGRRKRGFAQRSSGIDPGIVLWGLSEIARAASDNRHSSSGWGGSFGSGGGSDSGGWGGFGGGDFGGGGASGDW